MSALHSSLSPHESLARLDSTVSGLSSSQVNARRRVHGPNLLAPPPQPSFLRNLADNLADPLLLLLAAAAAVSLLLANYDDALSIALAILIVVAVAAAQQRRSNAALAALSRLVPHAAHITRDSHTHSADAALLVPGDIVTFSLGDRVPADVRILSSVSLEIDESSLTGESNPAPKNPNPVLPSSSSSASPTPVQLRTNIAFMGTLVVAGSATAVVVATGTHTEFGQLFSLVHSIHDDKTPLQLAMDNLAKRLSFISFLVIGAISLLGILQRRPILDTFTIAVSLAVAAIPEGLPVVVSVTLALGVFRMSKRNAIVKRLHSVESLGSVSVICSDKTGTLTTNQMLVTALYTPDYGTLDISSLSSPSSSSSSSPPSLSLSQQQAALAGNLCNNSFTNHKNVTIGKPTELAMLKLLPLLGLPDQRPSFTITNHIPFDSDKKWQSVTGSFSKNQHQFPPHLTTYLTGALEVVLDHSSYFLNSDGSSSSLDASARQKILHDCDQLSKRGLRLVAMASSSSTSSTSSSPLNNTSTSSISNIRDLIFLGAQGMLDPPRPGVSDAIRALSNAGVKTVMITGDSPTTAVAIARQLGILYTTPSSTTKSAAAKNSSSSSSSEPGCVTGDEIDNLSQRQLVDIVNSVSVFARTVPRHKMAIIDAFKSQGAVVAMTGDGVNDAPALKKADVGISMGKSGTDVAKEASQVILVDDNFSTILSAVEEGKSIFYNIQNFLCFQLSTAIAALTLITLCTIFNLPNPLNAMQILFINIIMDGPPSQSLGVDPVNNSVMGKPPRPRFAPILTRRLTGRVLFSASMVVLGCLVVYLYELTQPDPILSSSSFMSSSSSSSSTSPSPSSYESSSSTFLDSSNPSTRDQTMSFTAFVFLDLVSALQNRGLHCTLTQNRMLLGTISASLLVQLLLIYFPPLQSVFQTESLAIRDLTLLITLAAISAGLHEIRRVYERTAFEDDTSEVKSIV